MCYGEKQNWRLNSGKEQAAMAGLHCYLGPCLGQCWPMLMSMAPVTTEGHMDACGLGCHWCHVDVQGPCCYWGHINLSAPCCHQTPWHLVQSCSWGPCLGSCSRGLYLCLWPVLPLGVMGQLAQVAWTLESWSCPSLTDCLSWTGPSGIGTQELTQTLDCCGTTGHPTCWLLQ